MFSFQSRIAFISDIHGNLEALESVFKHIGSQGVDYIICLGDTLGYGPDPIECLNLVRANCNIVLMGNHDLAALDIKNAEDMGFGERAMQSTKWTIKTLWEDQDCSEIFTYLSGLEPSYMYQGITLCHGSPRENITEYIFPEDIDKRPEVLTANFNLIEDYAMLGHTHIPGMFSEITDDFYVFLTPEDIETDFRVGPKAILNVGSVGQPREEDKRARYLIWDWENSNFPKIAYQKIDYDWETTRRKILAADGLPDELADVLTPKGK